MARKVFAVLFICIVVFAAVHLSEADEANFNYKDCFDKCKTDCTAAGTDGSDCEMKCDDSCSGQEQSDRVEEGKLV
uniref:Major pollen allergen Ole e 6-like n=1 Tax=Nelumbo nucifera TaxID=4432 RepID=A0A822XH90_NELNU|nr:TPA_asm: hypothetical protein HUJ06_021060 [Nelumbo nucifera]